MVGGDRSAQGIKLRPYSRFIVSGSIANPNRRPARCWCSPKKPLHITPGEIRLLAVASSLAACVGGFTAAAISDRWSHRTVMLRGGGDQLLHAANPAGPKRRAADRHSSVDRSGNQLCRLGTVPKRRRADAGAAPSGSSPRPFPNSPKEQARWPPQFADDAGTDSLGLAPSNRAVRWGVAQTAKIGASRPLRSIPAKVT